jgi:hypothetical protein
MIGMGMEVAMGVGKEVAVGGFTWVGATVAGRGEAGAVTWLGVQPENTPLKVATITKMVIKWLLGLGFIFPLLDVRSIQFIVTHCHAVYICPTVCVTCWWVVVDNIHYTVNAKSRINSIYRGESHQSSARFVGRPFDLKAL